MRLLHRIVFFSYWETMVLEVHATHSVFREKLYTSLVFLFRLGNHGLEVHITRSVSRDICTQRLFFFSFPTGNVLIANTGSLITTSCLRPDVFTFGRVSRPNPMAALLSRYTHFTMIERFKACVRSTLMGDTRVFVTNVLGNILHSAPISTRRLHTILKWPSGQRSPS